MSIPDPNNSKEIRRKLELQKLNYLKTHTHTFEYKIRQHEVPEILSNRLQYNKQA